MITFGACNTTGNASTMSVMFYTGPELPPHDPPPAGVPALPKPGPGGPPVLAAARAADGCWDAP